LETPDDPTTWSWTKADKLFLKLIETCHQEGIRVIMDYSWNHTGITFWAWQDVLEKLEKSPYAGWYEIEAFDDPNTESNEFAYAGWAGVKELPELKQVEVVNREHGLPYEGNLAEPVKQHIFNVTRRWRDPNGDGDPSDGIDGFRLDVAEQVPMGFWRDYRKFVRNINPEAFLVGEIWWKEWPDEMMDPRPYVQGDVFDAVMHYQWYRPGRKLFANAEGGMQPSEFMAAMKTIYEGYRPEVARAMMNLTASHDTPRFATSFYNPGPYKKGCSPRETPDYKIDRPGDLTQRRQRLMIAHQFTFLGAPHVWNGDEAAMWGADDPDMRKPLLWAGPKYNYEDEITHPFGKERPLNEIKGPDQEFRDYYKFISAMRRKQPALRLGDLEWITADDENGILAYRRTYEDDEVIVIFSLADAEQWYELPNDGKRYYRVFSYRGNCELHEKSLLFNFEALGVVVMSTR
ncbi:MAG: alpha-amylase family glycosyl hydrolase, partial [Salibacteraceae bacterium]